MESESSDNSEKGSSKKRAFGSTNPVTGKYKGVRQRKWGKWAAEIRSTDSFAASTDSFAAANRLGQGGFGSVFKEILPSGQEIAVKLMSEASVQGEREFQNELSLTSRIDTACCPYVVCVLGLGSPFCF